MRMKIVSDQVTSEQKSTKKVTLYTVTKAIKSLTTFADMQYREIENFYRYDDRGYVFYNPMNVPANLPGGVSRGNWALQINAFVLAREVYFNLVQTNKNLPATLKSIKGTLDKLQFEKDSDLRANKISRDACPLEDRFYPAYQEFSQNIEEILTNLDKIQTASPGYEQEIISALTQHARYLIIEGKMTPEDFQSALDAYKKEETKDEYENNAINFDYFYQMNNLFSIHGALIIDLQTNGKVKSVSEIIPKDSQVNKLVNYLKKLNQEHVELFFEVFGDVYFQEVLYPKAQHSLQSEVNIKDEPTRWNMFQFWSQEQKDHYQNMTAVREEIQRRNSM
ncbi:hypothetical protein [Legionella brunensis]|uniref:Uncharacterized protein n=1 Tax=Legionella brunensis TaxID=29422 RepID=A0A0W0STX1_9GAMM|nr:hypothetical protein [Legionella brunensis]KTC86808.1 hypothetical protein Lbru_0749 [Legionella brunensis]